MIDITSQKVVIPTLAFLFMSPGVVATAPGDYAALAHAFAFHRGRDGGENYALSSESDRPHRHDHSLLGVDDREQQRRRAAHGARALDRVRDNLCVAPEIFSYPLLIKRRRMKYLVIGPARWGSSRKLILKSIERELDSVEEISGSSAGAVLALMLGMGHSIDFIQQVAMSTDISNFVRVSLTSFLNKFGLCDVEPVRAHLVKLAGGDPTFSQLDMTLYISAFCLNTGKTEYFSKHSHPDMRVVDAVCMSSAIPLMFSAVRYNGNTYVDGGTQESAPVHPFLSRPPHKVSVIRIKSGSVYVENIRNHMEFAQAWSDPRWIIRASIGGEKHASRRNRH